MALRWIESFDWATPDRRYNAIHSSTTPGRFGGYAWAVNWNGGPDFLITPNLGNQATWTCGAAMRLNDPYNTTSASWSFNQANGWPMFGLLDQGTLQLHLHTDQNGKLILSQGGIVLGTGGLFLPYRWTYVEMCTTFGSTGSAVVTQDGVTVISVVFDNMLSGNAYASQLQLGQPSWNQVGYALDDVYLCDGTGLAPFNGFLGEIRIDTARPIGAGAHTGFTPSAGNNWQNVSDQWPDNDSTYNSSPTPGVLDTYAIGSLTTSAAPLAIGVNWLARKDSFGGHTLTAVIRQAGTDYLVGSAHRVGSTYDCQSELVPQQPSMGAWTVAAINAAQFGLEITT